MNTVFYVYAIYSEVKNKIYIGFTSRSPQERLYAHNFIEKNSFTSKYRPWTIVYTEEFDSKEEALKKERK